MIPVNVQEIPEYIQNQLPVQTFKNVVKFEGKRPFTIRTGNLYSMPMDFDVFPSWPVIDSKLFDFVSRIRQMIGNGTVELDMITSGTQAGIKLNIKGDKGVYSAPLGELMVLDWLHTTFRDGAPLQEIVREVANEVGAL